MSQYIDGFLLTIPKSKLAAYKKIATKAGKIWRKHGALEYRECAAEDMTAPSMIPFPKVTKAKPTEIVIFSYVVFKSRKHRDAVNKKIFADPELQGMCEAANGIVDCKRMAYGGFESIVSL
ncbi:MAG: DUF1428 domain-containing protein [Verrucomicrobiales bacterium]|nr:DUF1428 domain-containing protein [Verrucomicrobiales bacterium]